MTRHLLCFQQVIQKDKEISTYFEIQAGLTSLEVKFNEWKWEEEVEVFTLEHIGLGETSKTYIHRLSHLLILYPALIINAVGLVLSLIVFIMEKIIHKISLRRAAHVTQDRLEVDYQGTMIQKA